ncbi:hypothetical protein BGX38DRAFT_1272146 [Terfezia claveryi]|nr:hypothetical protein BGX38DRAFT_1272146 [Terfezia claveryi]
MSEVQINLRRQILEFLHNYHILTKVNDDLYHWHYMGQEYNVDKDVVTRVINAILEKWMREEGIEDIVDFETKRAMTWQQVIWMISDLVKMHLRGLFGVA